MSTQMHDHIVKSYDDEQRRLLNETLRMGEMAASQLEAALDVVQRRDDKAAERIIANDEAIDALEQEVSHDVMKLALRGPMARDLREILAAIRIASDIERVGDYAANVAKRSLALNLSPPLPHVSGLHAIGTLAVQQVRDVLVAYRDNAAVLEGSRALRFFPEPASHVYASVAEEAHLVAKCETHNHPTAISPFPGAATGSGGEIRDEGATGRGAKPKAGLCGFSVSHLRIPGCERPWEGP